MKVIFLVFCLFLLLSGLYFKQGESTINLLKNGEKFKWVKNLFDADHSIYILF
jgi:hypothetical protein